MITSQGFGNFRLKVKLLLASLLVGWIAGSFCGLFWETKEYPPEAVKVFKKYVTARAVTSLGMNQTLQGKPTEFRKWLDQIKEEQPAVTLSMENKMESALLWPWPMAGAGLLLVIFLNIATIGFKRD